MKKQEYIDMWIVAWLSVSQIEQILCSVLGVSRERLFQMSEISSRYLYEVQKKFFDITNGTPTEYALEKANFYGREFYINQGVLIPRNDTEFLAQKAIEIINTHIQPSDYVYIDIGTGSACIPITLVEEMYPLVFSQIYAIDISSQALEVAQKNIERFDMSQKIETLESDILTALSHNSELEWKNLFLTANLPYIKNGDCENMDSSVILHEPDTALYGGNKTGFELYERLIKQCFSLKKILSLKNIILIIEIGFDQKETSARFLEELWLRFEYFQDNATIDRGIVIEWF